MSLSTGSKLGHYEIVESVGVGGMGEVYRAKDSKLGRDVAIKVLPDEFAQDEDRLRRFQREARVLAALNHPNIAAIYGLEHSEDTHYLVLEFVEGETLAERIARGAIPVEEALEVASKIAEALEQAHEQGIVHRDLKPANIKLTPDDNVKVLDFGLAKAFVEDSPYADSSMSPTITRDATRVGVILGTAAYMSPEQAKGKLVDRRADVWAFGAVVYEMLTGQRAFVGEDVSDTLAAVLRAEPNMDAFPVEVSAALKTALTRCLEKNPKARIRDIGDVQLAMEGAFESGVPATAVATRRGQNWPLTLAVAILSGLGAWALMSMRSPTRAGPSARFVVTTPSSPPIFISGNQVELALSPDGSKLIYRSADAGPLVERQLDALETRRIEGTQGAQSPFFSPDGASIAFIQDGDLKKMSVAGGAPVTVGPVRGGLRGASWSADGNIMFSNRISRTLNRVPAGGGEPQPLLTAGAGPEGAKSFRFPHVLPGGEALLFSIHDDVADPQVAVLEMSSSKITPLLAPGTHPRYVPTGHIVYGGGDGTLRAVTFDLDRLEVTGSPVALLDGVLTGGDGATGSAIADNGSLAYIAASSQSLRRLVWVDRSGREELIDTAALEFDLPRLSPDGRLVAVEILDNGNLDLHVVDLDRGTVVRLTRDLQEDTSPLWTEDGSELVFGSLREDGGVFEMAADGSGIVERLDEGVSGLPQPLAWSVDRDQIVFYESGGPRSGDIFTLDVASSEVEPLLTSPELMEAHPSLSPDGRWLAYTGSDSGRLEVYVRPFPDVDEGRVLVSDSGGNEPIWSHDGRELFYWSDETSSMMAVPVTLEPTFRPGIPDRLFQGDYLFPASGRHYDVSRDGQRFLMVKLGTGNDADAAPEPEIVVVQNWFAELERRVPATQ